MHICLMSRVVLAHGIKGGMERHAEILMRGLAARGHRFTVITTALPDSVSLPVDDVATQYLPGTPWRRYSTAWWHASAEAVDRLITVDPPDLIWSQSVAGLGYLKLSRAATRVPIVPIIHGTALGELRGSWRAWRHAPSLRGLAVVGLNAERRLREPLAWRRAAQRVERWIAVSERVADDLGYLGVSRRRVAVVPNGIDTARFRPDPATRIALRSELGLDPEAVVAVVAGRLMRQKGIDVAIRAAAHVSGLHLLVAGAGSAEGALRHLIASLGMSERTHLLGAIPYERVPALLAAADIGLLPSLLEEAFPLSVIEAMATGLPVLASRVGGVPTALRSGIDGELLPPADVAAWAVALRRLSSDGSLRERMGRNARERALACFDTQQMLDATETVFEQVRG